MLLLLVKQLFRRIIVWVQAYLLFFMQQMLLLHLFLKFLCDFVVVNNQHIFIIILIAILGWVKASGNHDLFVNNKYLMMHISLVMIPSNIHAQLYFFWLFA